MSHKKFMKESVTCEQSDTQICLKGPFGVTKHIYIDILFPWDKSTATHPEYVGVFVDLYAAATIKECFELTVQALLELTIELNNFQFQVSPYVLPVSLPIAQVFLTFSIFMTISLSLERYLVVSKPQHMVSNLWKCLHHPINFFQPPRWIGWVSSFAILCISLLINITR